MRCRGVDGPDTSIMVGGTSGQMADVRAKEDAGDVGGVCLERSHRNERGDVAVLNDAPDINVTLNRVHQLVYL